MVDFVTSVLRPATWAAVLATLGLVTPFLI